MVQRLTREEFHPWAESQKRRYERVAGEPVAMAPERVGHARIKSRVWAALDRAIQAADLPCEALPDGVTVRWTRILTTSPTPSSIADRNYPRMR